MLSKKIINKFGTHYLLGVNQDGNKVYLEEPTFDCGWYWGGLYLQGYTNDRQPMRSVDISFHTHFDTLFLNKGYEEFNKYFKETVLTKDEVWKLLELAKTFYILKDFAGICERGSAWVSKNDSYDTLKDQDLYLEIIQKKLPAVISAICNLLGGETTPEQFEKQAIYKE